MKILVVGSGGREHTLAWKLAQSSKVEKLFCAPGNAGIAEVAECVPIAADAIHELVEFAKKEKIDLTVVGPEQPLAEGISDLFKENQLKVFGPSKKAAQLEASKIFSKEFMQKYQIPTASFQTFSSSQEAISYLDQAEIPIVIKADGLAAGKGVIVAQTKEEAVEAVKRIMEQKEFGASGEKILIEDCLKGEEVSVLAAVDGKSIVALESSQDHKRIFDHDEGPNTGGMGAFSPSPLMDVALAERVEQQVLQPSLKGIQAEGLDFHGILYVGLMIDSQGSPFVLEYNVRFGDPETQAVLARLDSDLVDLVLATVEERLADEKLKWKKDKAICVVIASGGYPGKYEKGKEILGLEDVKKCSNSVVFHAGTSLKEGKVFTNGGRVLGVTSWGEDFEKAKAQVYEAVEKISFEGAFYRKDIGDKALVTKSV